MIDAIIDQTDTATIAVGYVRTELIGKGRIRAARLTNRGRWRIDVASVEDLVGEKKKAAKPRVDFDPSSTP